MKDEFEIVYEHEITEDAEDRLLKIFEFLFQNVKEDLNGNHSIRDTNNSLS